MKSKNYLLHSLLFLCLVLCGSAQSFAQNNEQEGMETKPKNYTSFSIREITNLEEWKKHNLPEYYDHPEFGKLPKDAPCVECVEDLSKRNFDERYFIDLEDPSKFYQQKALGNLHGQLNGDWVTIDHALTPVSNGVYESGFTEEQAGFNLEQHQVYIKTAGGTVYFNNWEAFSVSGNETTSLGDFSWDNYSVGDDGVYITDAFPGIDAEMIVFRGAVKTNFILKSNQFGVFDYLVFRDQFTTPESASMQFDEGSSNQGVGSFSLYSGNSNLLHIGEAVLFAKNGPKELVQAGEYVLNGNTMDVRVPFNWINDNIGSYQLIVDPIVTGTATLAQASITGSMYNASCNFTNSCNYNLAVSRPANATLTNVAWTFTYSANGTTCWLQDGGIRIATGGCVSPATAGYYWFCNAIGGGTCSGTNQTIWGDVSSCMPAPGCTPQNVNFTLQFFRSCWGATGCGNACIGAGSPWTMTITGQTLNYTNTVTPIMLSATTVCAGGSITASTTGQYGVPGYSYNWSFSPTGTPSLATTSSASITFPTSGSVTLYSIVTDACGNQVVSSRVVTVTPGPTVSVNSPTICAGSSATLTASGATTYTWTPTATLSSGTGASVTATPSVTTTYTVVGTTAGCSGTATSTVTVNPLPVITVNSPSICDGGSATLTASGATSYTWTPTATLSSGTGSPVTATPTTTTTYTVTGTTGSCTGTATATVTVSSNPVVTVNSPTICEGASATLTAAGATSYTWTPTATLSSGTGNPVTATPTTTTTYTVTGTTGTCTGTATATVTVNPNPVVTVLSPSICAGGSAVLNAGGGATTYTWTPSATLSSSTGTPVTATPATTTTYTVTGTTAGCSGTATSTVTVNPIPVISVNDATICEGGSATIIPTGAGYYTWTPSASLSSSVGSPVIASPTTTTTYTITGTLAGCTSTATSTVTVNPNPVITVNSPTICTGASDVLTASGATSYTWTPTATLSSGTGSSVTASPTTTTTYTVTGTTGACSGTATSTVTVNPLPTVTVNSPTICAGASATLTANGATTYTWTPTATLSSGTGNSVTATPAATTTYTVTGTSLGCSNTANSTVTVNAIPTISASNNGPLCPGQTLILTGTGQAGGTYSWSGPNSFTNLTQNPQITGVSSSTEGTYTVTITLNGCTNSATTTFALSPNVPSTINANGPYCQNDPVTVLSAVNPGGTWSGAGITNPSTGAFDPALATLGNNTITYQISGACSTSSTATVVVNGLPTPTFTTNVTEGCAPLNVQFINTTAGASSAQWDLGNGSTFSQMNPSTTYNNVGCYPVSLEVTDANGCSNAVTMNSLICVLSDPNAQFVVGNQTAPIANPIFQFVNSSTDAVSYTWNFGDGTSNNLINPSHTYSQSAGSYLVQLIAYNAAGCSDTAQIIVTVKDDQIFYIPNAFTPNGDESNNAFEPVFTSGIDESNFSLVIYNRWGETLFETKNPAEGWDGTYHGQIVPAGSYVWSLRFKDPKSDDKFEFSGNVSVNY